MSTVTIQASASYGQSGQFVARIVGRDHKFTFNREFLGRKEGKRRESTSVELDTPGLYEARNVDRKGRANDTYYVVWDDDGTVRKNEIDRDEAMALGKQIDAGSEPDWHTHGKEARTLALNEAISRYRSELESSHTLEHNKPTIQAKIADYEAELARYASAASPPTEAATASTERPTMTEYQSRVYDAMRWVAQEARAIKMSGVVLPSGSRLNEALAALDEAFNA